MSDKCCQMLPKQKEVLPKQRSVVKTKGGVAQNKKVFPTFTEVKK